jgi:hypothetical protein
VVFQLFSARSLPDGGILHSQVREQRFLPIHLAWQSRSSATQLLHRRFQVRCQLDTVRVVQTPALLS